MFRKPKIEVIQKHHSQNAMGKSDHILFFLQNGSGSLETVWYSPPKEEPPYSDYYFALTLFGQPLFYFQSSGCPTCESMIAAGHGMPEGSGEAARMTAAMRAPYDNIESALIRLKPLLSLLGPGLYTLSMSPYYPTDGDGHFFWDAENDFHLSPATAQIYDSRNFRCLTVPQCFLYPSQSTRMYDEARTAFYLERLKAGEELEPVLAYGAGESISVLLDGHHRASACALAGTTVPCLTVTRAACSWQEGRLHAVIWPGAEDGEYRVKLSGKQEKLLQKCMGNRRIEGVGAPQAGVLFERDWPEEFTLAASVYPTCFEAAALMLYPGLAADSDAISELAGCADSDEEETAAALLQYFSRQRGADRKTLALRFAQQGIARELRKAAFRILTELKDDEEISDFFVDFLVNCEDRSDPLFQIADHYWDTWQGKCL